MPRLLLSAMALVLLLPLTEAAYAPARAQALPGETPEVEGEQDAPPVARAEGDVPYEVIVSGVSGALAEAIRQRSRLIELQGDVPPTVLSLRRRVRTDVARFREVLQSRGYYEAEVIEDVDVSTSPARISIRIQPGPQYRIGSFEVNYENPELEGRGDLPQMITDVALEQGEIADAQKVLDTVAQVALDLRDMGYPFARVLEHKAVINRDRKVLNVTVQVEAGPLAYFGGTEITGLERVKEGYIQRRIPWTQGELFSRNEIAELRRQLLATGLFEVVDIEPAEEVGDDQLVPITITVEEADQRSLGVGASYSSAIGPAVTAFWENRNLFGRNEDLRAELTLSLPAQSIDVAFLRPDFLQLDQELTATAEITREELDAFDRNAILASVGISRPLTETWDIGAGISLELANISDETGDERVFLVGFPLSAARDTTVDPLDPREGMRLNFHVTPFAGTFRGATAFVKNEAEAVTYIPLREDGGTVLAGRVELGTIVGGPLFDIPPDQRLYSGGGGSLRGYGFQMAGPLDENNNPVGGKSLLELGVEVRQRVTESIEIVPFFEAGRTYEEALPNPFEDLLYSAGIGARYLTPIGPIRLDVAVPLNRRDADDPFQFYISLGQAF